MSHEIKHKVIITGTGRTGTTLLVQLLTELGLDTGYTSRNWREHYYEYCSAGLEGDLEDLSGPYIVKNPSFCETLPATLARERIVIDLALIPVRRLDDATLSRVRVGGGFGRTPGGMVGTDDPARQKGVLAENFHQLIETLVAHDIPHVFLHFPRFANDAAYAYEKLRPLLGSISQENFGAAFARVARPDLIHSFASGLPADAGQLARIFSRRRSVRRAWRYGLRSAAGATLVGVGWLAAHWFIY